MNQHNFAVLGYLPPKGVGTVDSFLANMKRFPTKHPLLFYSYAWRDKEGVIPMKADVDYLRVKYPKVKMAVNNAVFYTGLRIAAAQGLTHFLCIEPDCRVNCAGWDDIVWQEFLAWPNAICGGTPVAFNACSWSGEASARFERYLFETSKIRPVPMTLAGGGHTAERHQPCVFPNGAFAIYSMEWFMDAFPEIANGSSIEGPADMPHLGLALRSQTWDAEVGYRLWNQMEHKVYDRLACFGSIYSGYGDVMTSEWDRRKLLESGRVVGVHQIKSGWEGPEVYEPVANFYKTVMNESKREAILEDIQKAREILDAGSGLSLPATARSPIPDARPTSVGGKADVPASSVFPFKGSELEKTLKTAMEPKTDIFIVTFARDFAYLRYCLRSIDKFCTGFHGVKILIPDTDCVTLAAMLHSMSLPDNVSYLTGVEWPGKGMLWHEAQIMRADEWCPEADFIAHLDADVIFTAPVRPSTFFRNGKPVLRYEPFESIIKRRPEVGKWQTVTEKCLPFPVPFETMRGHPHVFWRFTYKATRSFVEQKTHQAFDDYMRAQKNDFPQSVCEFVTLGNVAIYLDEFVTESTGSYSLEDLSKSSTPDLSPWPVQQFWAHSPPDKPQTTWVNGKVQEVTPAELAEKILS